MEYYELVNADKSIIKVLNILYRYSYGHWNKIKNYLDYHGYNFN